MGRLWKFAPAELEFALGRFLYTESISNITRAYCAGQYLFDDFCRNVLGESEMIADHAQKK